METNETPNETPTGEPTSSTESTDEATTALIAFAVAVLRDYIRPAADQWARSSRTAQELAARDRAKGIAIALQSLIAALGPDFIIPDGRNDTSLANALAILVVGKVVGGYIAAPDERMGRAIPADAIFRVAASTGSGL